MKIEITIEFVKKNATILKEYLKAANIPMKQSNALHAVSKMYGFKDWNTFSAFLKQTQKE